MKARYLISAVLLCVLGSITIIRINALRKTYFEVKQGKGERSSVGTRDNPQARTEYELNRLRSPLTNQIPEDIRRKELAFAEKLNKETADVRAQLQKTAAIRTSNWAWRGPYNIGGRTRALAIDVTSDNIILAGGVSGGMWRSTDGGTSWTKTTTPEQLHSVTCIVQDTRPGKTNIWYYGTGEYRGNSASGGGASYRGDGIFKSTDGGQSWTVLPSTATNKPHQFDQDFDYVWNILIDVSNTLQDEVYTALYGGIYRSVDGGGTSWTQVLGTGTNTSPYCDIAITSTGIVYATLSSTGTQKGIWRSTDGINWLNITPAAFPTTYSRIVIAVAPSNINVVYFLGNTPNSGSNDHSLWKYTYLPGDSSGSGGYWEDRSSSLPAQGGYTGNFDSQDSYDLVIKVKPDDENVVFIGGTNLYRSTNGFANNSQTTWIGGYVSTNNAYNQYLNHHCDQHAIAFYPSNYSKMLNGNDGGVYRTDNNLASTVVWTKLNNGYNTTQYYTIAVNENTSGSNVIVGGTQDNGTFFINSVTSNNWVTISSGDGAFCAVGQNNLYYTSYQNGEVRRDTINSSGTISKWTRIDPTGGTGYLFINPFAMDPNNTKMIYIAGGTRVWRNTDVTQIPNYSNNTTSVNWTELTNTIDTETSITAIAVSRTPANRVYYGTSKAKLFRLDNANSENPVPIDIGTGKGFTTNAYVSCIAINPDNADQVLLTFSNYSVKSLFYTADGGTSWTDVSGNLEQYSDGAGNGPSVRWGAVVPKGGSIVYFAATSTGLYSTTSLNGSNTVWLQEGIGTIGNVVVDMIAARPSDGAVVIGTHGAGVFSTNVITYVNSPSESSPQYFELLQNYPNPFNPETRILFRLPKPENVTIKIYSIIGQEVTMLFTGHKPAGTHTITWNGTNSQGVTVPSGIYICRVTAGNYSKQIKMVLVK